MSSQRGAISQARIDLRTKAGKLSRPNYAGGVPKAIEQCRVCGNRNLETILDLGVQYLTGVFPNPSDAERVGQGPLELVLCAGDSTCGLVQLRHSFPPSQMYGDSYGYRSGLNPTMVNHLQLLAERSKNLVTLQPNDVVIDIGSNDGTTLGFFDSRLSLIGVDPSAKKFAQHYRDDIIRIPEFFSIDAVKHQMSGRKAKLIFSIAMMYDLEDPIDFARQVAACLEPDGVWVFEQSYLPMMIDQLAYDTVCHEHIEYYGIKQLEWILREAEMKIIDIQFSPSNGGSVAIGATHLQNESILESPDAESAKLKEHSRGFHRREIFEDFAFRVAQNKSQVLLDIDSWKKAGKIVAGLGASTKGNVLLQYLGVTHNDIAFIGDINPDKHGRVTPGSLIPIISEQACLEKDPDVLIVLPWHFANFFENAQHLVGKDLYFPLPNPRLFSVK